MEFKDIRGIYTQWIWINGKGQYFSREDIKKETEKQFYSTVGKCVDCKHLSFWTWTKDNGLNHCGDQKCKGHLNINLG